MMLKETEITDNVSKSAKARVIIIIFSSNFNLGLIRSCVSGMVSNFILVEFYKIGFSTLDEFFYLGVLISEL